MSYEKTTWETGDIVTAEKLNNIENGIENAGGGSTFVVNVEFEVSGLTCDKTWAEILNAGTNGESIIFVLKGTNEVQYFYPSHIFKDGKDFIVATVSVDNNGVNRFVFSTNSENGYPYWGVGPEIA